MIDREIYDRIATLTHSDGADIYLAMMEELGEYARAVRFENGKSYKNVDEDSKTELIDLILVAIEAYILRGGRFDEVMGIAKRKLDKWEQILKSQK